MKRLLSVLLLLSIGITALTAGPVYAVPITSTEEDTIVPMPSGLGVSALREGTAVIQAQTAGTASTLPFTDVHTGNWFYEDVLFAYEAGLMKGVTATTFVPSGTLTRGELVTVLYRLDGEREVSGSSGFADVPEGRYYSDAVTWASGRGIVKGVTDLEFRPKDPVTREQIAVIFYRYYVEYIGNLAQEPADLTGYVDYNAVSNYAKAAMAWAIRVGLVKGTNAAGESPRLEPRSFSTRAQVATFLNRMNCLLEKGSIDQENRSSGEIIAFIKSREGFSSMPYWDYSQWTVGYGTRCGTLRDGSDVPDFYWDGITEEEADRLLRKALAEDYEQSVERYETKHGLSFTQGQFDALVSFTFNLGALWTTGGYILTNWLEAPASQQTDLGLVWGMGVWCRVAGSVTPGTCERRMKEALIFLYDDYTATDSDHPYYCYVRYTGNGSLLTDKYTDDVGYYVKGGTYGSLPNPVWRDPANASAMAEGSSPIFAGWFTRDGVQVTASSKVRESLTLVAHWE